MKLRGLVVLGVTLSMAAVAPVAIADIPGYEYKLVLKGTGTQDVTMTGNPAQYTLHQSASWKSEPGPVTVWLPKFNGPPGQQNAGEHPYTTSETLPQLGNVSQTGTTPDPNNSGSSLQVNCPTAPITYTGSIIQRVIVTPLDPTIELETDYNGSFLAGGSRTFGPCSDGNYARFAYDWGNPQGQRLQVGIEIPPQQLGEAALGGPAKDFSNVTVTQSDGGWTTANCQAGRGACAIKFQMGGDYLLTLICKGTIGAGGVGTCGGSPGHGGGPGGNGNQGKCVVPDVTGKTVQAATRALSAARCALGKVQRVKSRKFPKGKVITSNPPAFTKHKAGTRVDLAVSSGR